FDEGGLATPIRCGYLGTVRRKGRKQISQPKEVIASSLLYPDLPVPGNSALYAVSVRWLIVLHSGFLRTVSRDFVLAFG
ncbi:MAG: hypothetical protein WA096_11190, partial [Smithella sp.]